MQVHLLTYLPLLTYNAHLDVSTLDFSASLHMHSHHGMPEICKPAISNVTYLMDEVR